MVFLRQKKGLVLSDFLLFQLFKIDDLISNFQVKHFVSPITGKNIKQEIGNFWSRSLDQPLVPGAFLHFWSWRLACAIRGYFQLLWYN